MGKAALTAPLYISVAWSLIISYQLFTQTAVYSIVYFLNIVSPAAGEFVVSRLSTIVFVHAFAWIFVLSSVIPSIILGKGRSVLLQFFLCLTITLVAVSVEDVFTLFLGSAPTAQVQNAASVFQNPLVAGMYLSAPYLIMLYLDIRERRRYKMDHPKETETPHADVVSPLKRKEAVLPRAPEPTSRVNETRTDRGMRFLYGASIACFLLAFTPLFLDSVWATNVLAFAYTPVHVATFALLGALLLGLGVCTRTPRTAMGLTA